ncbi:MAG: nuclear transport factor 2 family protein [Amaricoccus sp.]
MSNEIETLLKRVQLLEDKQAITELKYRYFKGLDMREPETVRDIFDPNGCIIDFGEWGRFDNVDDFVKVFISEECQPHVLDTHHGHNIRITVTGEDTAEGRVDLHHGQVRTDNRTVAHETCYYNEKYIRHSGRWWIKELRFFIYNEVVYSVEEDGSLKIKVLGKA